MGDPERYRSKDEVQRFMEKGPINNYRSFLFAEKIATEEELEEIDQSVEQEIEAAIEFAHQSPEPADEALFEHIYVENG